MSTLPRPCSGKLQRLNGAGFLRHRARQRPITYHTTARVPTKKPIGQLDQKEAVIDTHTVMRPSAPETTIASASSRAIELSINKRKKDDDHSDAPCTQFKSR